MMKVLLAPRACGIPSLQVTHPMDKNIKSRLRGCKDMLKGRTAEVLVEELFRLMNYTVHRYGVENSVPSLLHELGRFRNNRIIDKVRSLPDFIVTCGNVAYELEVKYREDSSFGLAELASKYDEYQHVEVLFVVVSPETIKCISHAQLQRGEVVEPGGGHFLGDRQEFAQHRDLIGYYTGFVRNVFSQGLRNQWMNSSFG